MDPILIRTISTIEITQGLTVGQLEICSRTNFIRNSNELVDLELHIDSTDLAWLEGLKQALIQNHFNQGYNDVAGHHVVLISPTDFQEKLGELIAVFHAVSDTPNTIAATFQEVSQQIIRIPSGQYQMRRLTFSQDNHMNRARNTIATLPADLPVPGPNSVALNNIEFNTDNLPLEYCCPISLDVMSDPVNVIGHKQITFDRPYILYHLSKHNFNPVNRRELTSAELEPNTELKKIIDDFVAEKIIENDNNIKRQLS